MHDVVDLLGTILKGLLLLFCRWVTADINLTLLHDDQCGIDLIDNPVDFFSTYLDFLYQRRSGNKCDRRGLGAYIGKASEASSSPLMMSS